jgi:hypothetical protein
MPEEGTMSFNAIQGIPPLPPIVGPRPSSDLHAVFAAEFGRQQGGETEAREEPRRGLESEEDEEELVDLADRTPRNGIHIVI